MKNFRDKIIDALSLILTAIIFGAIGALIVGVTLKLLELLNLMI